MDRVLNACVVAGFFFAFLHSYEVAVAPIYDYYGMGWRDTPAHLLVAGLLMNMSIALVATPAYRAPSQVFFIVQFLVIFLPATIVCLNTTRPELPQDQVMGMLIAMYVGLLLQAIFLPGRCAHRLTSAGGLFSRPIVLATLGVCAGILIGITVVALRDVFRIVDLETMYSQRDLFDEQSLSWYFHYGLSWLMMVVLPVMFIWALSMRGAVRLLSLCVCFMAYIVLYGITATKTALFAPVIIVAMYFLLRSRPISYIAVFSIFFSAAVLLPLILSAIDAAESIRALYTAIVNFRIFAVPQVTYVQYLDFFAHNPLTYGSHIRGVNLLVAYPFDTDVFLLVGQEFYASALTANAGMWIQDGLAGFGLPGIVLVSVLAIVVFRVLDRAACGANPRQVGSMMAMLALALSNTSLFTTLLTSGLLFAIALLYLTNNYVGRSGGKLDWSGRLYAANLRA